MKDMQESKGKTEQRKICRKSKYNRKYLLSEENSCAKLSPIIVIIHYITICTIYIGLDITISTIIYIGLDITISTMDITICTIYTYRSGHYNMYNKHRSGDYNMYNIGLGIAIFTIIVSG